MPPHREEYLQLAHVSHDHALIAWGAFFFEPKGSGKHVLIDDDRLEEAPIGRRNGSVGAETESYGAATVRVFRLQNGARVEALPPVTVNGSTHARVPDLHPDTTYEYEVDVAGKAWGAAPHDLDAHGRKGRFVAAKPYVNRFTTFPHPGGASQPVTFAVIGDPGTGDDAQYNVAARLESLLVAERVRFVVTTGDNIYAQGSLLEKILGKIVSDEKSSGKEDDDWFETFYHPYRRIINRVPFFPCLGNHDTEENEAEADLPQHIDNFFLEKRFPTLAPRWRDENGNFHTLFYRFRCGPDLEMVALDTGRPNKAPAFERPEEKAFIKALATDGTEATWCIPFSHHPPFSVGPKHPHEPNVSELTNTLTALDAFRLWLSGHEHNWQHHVIGAVNFVVTGASGKRDKGIDKQRVHPGVSCCHSAELHFLLVTVDGKRLTIRALGVDGNPVPTTQLADLPAHGSALVLTQ